MLRIDTEYEIEERIAIAACEAAIQDNLRSQLADSDRKLLIARNALERISTLLILEAPKDWDMTKMGGYPELHDYDVVNYIAEEALVELKK